MLRHVLFSALSCALAVCSGCGESEDPQLLAQRAKLLLSSKPDGAVEVLAAKKSFEPADFDEPVLADDPAAEEPAAKSQPLVVRGAIGGVDSPWQEGKAAFFIVDTSATSHKHADGTECPFCKKNKAKSLTLVQFLDAKGQVISRDARKLFGVETGQTVVVRGQGKIDELGSLVLSAEALYVEE